MGSRRWVWVGVWLSCLHVLACSAEGAGGERAGRGGSASPTGLDPSTAVGDAEPSAAFDNQSPGAGAAAPPLPVGPDPGSDGVGLSDEDTCGSQTIDASVEVVEQPGNVLVIFDRSNSMNADFTTPSGPAPRYQAAGDALLAAIEPLADKLTVGSILFPSVGGTLFCTAEVDPITSGENIAFMPGGDFIPAWQSYWQSHTLNFGTWINRAFERAEEALTTTPLTGATAVVLFSDGEPVCQSGVPADQQAAAWAARGIPTYVVGLPGALGSPYLTGIANQGGQGGFITPADTAALEQELATIARSTVRSGLHSCAIELDVAPEDPARVHLVVEAADSGERFDVPRERTPGDGWSLSDDGLSVTLTGALCEEARGGRFSSVTFQFGCVELPLLVD